jgi:hypothetical protein
LDDLNADVFADSADQELTAFELRFEVHFAQAQVRGFYEVEEASAVMGAKHS